MGLYEEEGERSPHTAQGPALSILTICMLWWRIKRAQCRLLQSILGTGDQEIQLSCF